MFFSSLVVTLAPCLLLSSLIRSPRLLLIILSSGLLLSTPIADLLQLASIRSTADWRGYERSPMIYSGWRYSTWSDFHLITTSIFFLLIHPGECRTFPVLSPTLHFQELLIMSVTSVVDSVSLVTPSHYTFFLVKSSQPPFERLMNTIGSPLHF